MLKFSHKIIYGFKPKLEFQDANGKKSRLHQEYIIS